MEVERLNRNGKYGLRLAVVEQIAIRRLAAAYSLTDDAMITACFNKGVDVIGKQVRDNEARVKGKSDEHQQGDGG